jgi:hypothetical protein
MKNIDRFTFSNKLAKEWNYKWYGFRGAEEKYIGKTYKLEDYVDTSCPPEIKEKIISYLDTAPLVLVGQVPERRCGLCDDLIHPAAYRSDGIWLWPDGLVHDVSKHNFCIPNQMLEHILEQDGTPPEYCGIPWQELPWP